jgi:hypothetical protein
LRNFEAAKAFANSANGIRNYLRTSPGLAIPAENLLWLFDADNAVNQYDQINDFLGNRLKSIEALRGRGVVIFFVYVGHGAFFGAAREYCLLVRDTRSPIEADTSLRVGTLSKVLKEDAPESSRILVLDCCFAGEAVRSFQGSLDQAVAAKAHELIEREGPDRGVALLCASSSRNPARLASASSYTLFGREFIRVLTTGDPQANGPLNLRQICNLVRRGLESNGTDGISHPEVHVPDQVGGDLAAVPLFPNRARLSNAQDQGQGRLLYDSNKDPETFRRDWGYFNTGRRFDDSYFADMPGVAKLRTASIDDVGMNLFILTLCGSIAAEYLVESDAAQGGGRVYFCVIPMKGRASDLLEVGSAMREDPRNPTSEFRRRKYIPAVHYNDRRWHAIELKFDFRDTPTASYAILAPRINEGVSDKGPATLYFRNVQVWDHAEQDRA